MVKHSKVWQQRIQQLRSKNMLKHSKVWQQSSATEKQKDVETFKGVAAKSSATQKQKDGQTFKGRKGLYTSTTQTYSNEVVRHIHFHMLKIGIGQQWRPGWWSSCPGNDKTKDGTFKRLPWHQQKLKMVRSSGYPGINKTKDSVF